VLYYWYIKNDTIGFPQIHIISSDKKLQLAYRFDKEITVGSAYIKDTLQKYFAEHTKF
jgi:hypothetical protein